MDFGIDFGIDFGNGGQLTIATGTEQPVALSRAGEGERQRTIENRGDGVGTVPLTATKPPLAGAPLGAVGSRTLEQ